jgi:hypothetical protein
LPDEPEKSPLVDKDTWLQDDDSLNKHAGSFHLFPLSRKWSINIHTSIIIAAEMKAQGTLRKFRGK